ncbi:hypothetical protein B0O99DRAFT_514838 [Bisporella sp. PMI_857]|nr:hypothetical protein B0O99DRAFT_514838 [Bisporella sp. PMI_857]
MDQKQQGLAPYTTTLNGRGSYPHHPSPNVNRAGHDQQQQLRSPTSPHQPQHPLQASKAEALSPQFPQYPHHLAAQYAPLQHSQQPRSPTPFTYGGGNQQHITYSNAVPTSLPGGNAAQATIARSTPTKLEKPEKKARISKACDSCSTRKVKVDCDGNPCEECVKHNITCTRDRESRQRGPPNKHIQQIKAQENQKRKLEEPDPNGRMPPGPPVPQYIDSPPGLLPYSPGQSGRYHLEQICPLVVLGPLVDDFFTYIHPLAPLPHEPSFRASFEDRKEHPEFLALTSSMVGVLVASFPRKPRLHLKANGLEHLFPRSVDFVEHCRNVALTARGVGYLEHDPNVYQGIISYFLGLASAYTHKWARCRVYFAEALTIARVLGAHKTVDPSFLTPDASTYSVDLIIRELGRRLWWIMFIGARRVDQLIMTKQYNDSNRSLDQLGASLSELLIPPPTPTYPYPPYPVEIDDEFITRDHIGQQPEGVISQITGYNTGLKIYHSLTPVTSWAMTHGTNIAFDWYRQKKELEDCIRKVKDILENVPAVLKLKPGSEPGQFESVSLNNGLTQHVNGQAAEEYRPDGRRAIQFEIQKANIYASQLGTRSYLVELYSILQEQVMPGANLDDDSSNHMAQERETIVKDLLRVSRSISQVNMEPNSSSFINKIRQVASTLHGAPQNRKGDFARKAEEYLPKFLELIMKLERVGTPGEDSEEDELRHWADIREYQMQFAQSGGFLLQ